LELKKRGYIVLPDPEDKEIQEAFKKGAFKEFERHSRLGMVDEERFYKEVERLKKLGAKYVTLKTGAYRPADLARAVKFSSEAKIDLLTVDGSGGGTGMSPWRMMNEWGIPTVQLECLLYRYLKRLEEKKRFIPSCAIAGGLCLEDHVFKAIAIAAPFIKAVCLGRATLTAAMVGNTIGKMVKEGKIPEDLKKYGDNLEQIFVCASQLKERYGRNFSKIPAGAIGIFTFYDRLTLGLKQLMAGARKFSLRYISRDDLLALTREAALVSGISYVMDADEKEVEKILN